MLSIYFQMPINVHAFVGSVALAGMQGDLWCVDGGNYRVAEELVQRTGSTFLSARVWPNMYTFLTS